MSDFVAVLNCLSEHCNYATELNMLRDRIVWSINNAAVQMRLLESSDLTFEDAVKTALVMKPLKRMPVNSVRQLQVVYRVCLLTGYRLRPRAWRVTTAATEVI